MRSPWLPWFLLLPLAVVVAAEMQQAPPSSAPRRLTIRPVEGTSDAVRLNWEAPTEPQGEITGERGWYLRLF